MQFSIKIHYEISEIKFDKATFSQVSNPFSKITFFKILEDSKVIGNNSGWIPLYFCVYEKNKCIAIHYTFLKSHSYGEYIFDWAWADFYNKNGIPYYPKIISAIPFSPINAPKFIFKNDLKVESKKIIKKQIRTEIENFIKKQVIISSYHYLFSQDSSDKETFQNYIERTTLQYHFQNKYESFEDFINSLKARKRKNILKERKEVKSYPINIEIYDGDFPKDIEKSVYDLYLTTIDKKYSHAYLNYDFFTKLFQNFSKNLLLFIAYEEEEIIAMSLFFKSNETLFGRYWGMKQNKDYRYLHFEMCYYLGIEYCIKNKIPLFEAGAQGEQKLLRGFRPVEIKSFHKISIDQIHEIIQDHVKQETESYRKEIKRLNDFLPYK